LGDVVITNTFQFYDDNISYFGPGFIQCPRRPSRRNRSPDRNEIEKRTKAAIAKQRKFGALLKVLRVGVT